MEEKPGAAIFIPMRLQSSLYTCMDIHSRFACVGQLTVNTTNAILYSCMAKIVPNAGKRPLLSMMYNTSSVKKQDGGRRLLPPQDNFFHDKKNLILLPKCYQN